MVVRIDAETYYDDWRARMMGIDGDALEQAREAGEVRYKMINGVPVYKGAWLMEWLDHTEHAGQKAGAR